MEGKAQGSKRPYIKRDDKKHWHYYIITYISGKADGINRVWLMTIVHKLLQILSYIFL